MRVLVEFVLTIVLIGAASAFTSGLVVEDNIFEPFREWVWSRWPYEGHGLPVQLDGGRSAMSQGTFIGNVIACVRCFGVYTTAVWCAGWWVAFGFTGHGAAQSVVLAAVQFAAACQVQRWWNARTALNHR